MFVGLGGEENENNQKSRHNTTAQNTAFMTAQQNTAFMTSQSRHNTTAQIAYRFHDIGVLIDVYGANPVRVSEHRDQRVLLDVRDKLGDNLSGKFCSLQMRTERELPFPTTSLQNSTTKLHHKTPAPQHAPKTILPPT